MSVRVENRNEVQACPPVLMLSLLRLTISMEATFGYLVSRKMEHRYYSKVHVMTAYSAALKFYYVQVFFPAP
jgi:hypothetical protein